MYQKVLLLSLMMLFYERPDSNLMNPRVIMVAGKMYKFANGATDAEIVAHVKAMQTAEKDFPILTGAAKVDDVVGDVPGDPLEILKSSGRIYEQSFDRFKEAAISGKLNKATGTKLPGEAEAKTSLILGEINQYSDQDIAHFYARRFGYKAPGDRLRPDDEALAEGYKNLIEDAQSEGRVSPEKATALLATVAAASTAEAGQGRMEVRPEQIRTVATPLAKKTGVPVAILMAKAQVESSGWHGQTSKAGAVGLFQMLPSIGKAYGDTSKGKDWKKQAAAAAAMMADMKKKFKTWPMAIAAYNWGETNLRAHLRKGLKLSDPSVPEETRKHVAKMIIEARKNGYDIVKDKPIGVR